MKKSTKIWLGIATFWPVLYIFVFIAAIALMMVMAPHAGGRPGPGFDFLPLGFVGLMFVHMVTIFGSMALTVFYIIRVFKTEVLDQNLKIMWTLLLFFFGMMAQPIFWYLYIWREPVPALTNPPQLPPPGPYAAWGQQTSRQPEGAYVPPPQPPDWR